MKLYHFTSPLHVESCKKNGLTRGVIPLLVNGKIAILPGYQWLTANPDFNQSWANTEYTTLPYDRTAFRLTVVIPKTAQGQLFKWLDVCHKFPIDEYLNAYGDPENWHIFKGKIKPSWIRAIDNNREFRAWLAMRTRNVVGLGGVQMKRKNRSRKAARAKPVKPIIA